MAATSNASKTTPQAPSSSDQYGLDFHPEDKLERKENGGKTTPSTK